MISPYCVFTMLWDGVLTTFGAIQALRNWFSFLWDHPCTTLTNFSNFRTPMVGFPTGRDSAQFALAIVPGQRDPRTRFFFCPRTKGQRDVPSLGNPWYPFSMHFTDRKSTFIGFRWKSPSVPFQTQHRLWMVPCRICKGKEDAMFQSVQNTLIQVMKFVIQK